MDDGHVYIVTTAAAPSAYWEGRKWTEHSTIARFDKVMGKDRSTDLVRILRTVATGDDALLDADYLAQRLGSGLHPAHIRLSALAASNEGHRLAESITARTEEVGS